MVLSLVSAVAADLLAIGLLARVVYFRRYHRRDLLLAYVALNAGVLAVTAVLTESHAGVGLGLGLFGILSIIRLRSSAISQEEVAYYFVALALGLVCGLHPQPAWLAPSISAALVAVMVVVDHPRSAAGARRHRVTLDRAYADPAQARAAVESVFGVAVRRVDVVELDLVQDLTLVDVRLREETPSCVPAATPAAHRLLPS
jgi:hypothetical protein